MTSHSRTRTRSIPRLRCFPHFTHALLMCFLVVVSTCKGWAAVEVLGVQYQQDNPYPEYNCWYHYGSYPATCGISITGVNAHVFLKNTGASSVTINDVNFAGHNLNTVLKTVEFNGHFPSSIYLYWDDPPADILNAGEPIWYRADPNPIPAGGTARVVVRLRKVPVTQPISLGVATTAGTINTNIPVDASTPVLASVGFSTNRTKVYLHWRRPSGGGSSGAAPASVWLDGTNVTSLTTTVGDPAMNFAVSVIQLPTALPNMSYHVFQGRYADGKTATGSLRVWVNRFLYGTWGVREIPDNNTAAAQAWINECQVRGVNCYVNNTSGGLQDYMQTGAGQAYAEARDYGYVKDSNTWGTNPRMWFIDDEPDLQEGTIEGNFCGTGLRIPCGTGHTPGIMGRHLLAHGETLRAQNPLAPTTINLDGNFKPEGWLTYGQFADVMMMDSYYEGEQAGAHWDRPNAIPLFRKATSIYAAAIATTTGAEPNPMHMILNSVEWRNGNGDIWPFSSPAGKRIQAYYALAGGAKGMAYWWFKKGYPYNGLGDGGPEATALWKEIGLLGNEIKTAQPLLVISHPVTLPLTPSTNVWARMLAADTHTLMLIAVNDNYLNDQSGTHITNVLNATVGITLPTWMQPSPTAFEISCGGLKPVSTQVNGSQLQINLGTLQVTKMIVLTKDPTLLSTLQQRYDTLVRPGICTFASESCTNVPLNIAQGPANLVLTPGGSGSFAVAAFGTGLKYQWQKNNFNLSNGGHYSGCTNAVLTVTGADGNDEANYRCVVSTAYSTNTSTAATLSLTTNPPASPVATLATDATTNSFTANWNSADGATGYRLDVSTNSGFGSYLSGYQDLDVGSVLSRNITGLTVDTTYYYRVRAYNANGASGNSATISVRLTAPITCPPTGLVNAGFEGGHTGGVASGWTAYEVASPTVKAWSIQNVSPPEGLQYQQIQAYNDAHTASAGVRQNITGCVVGATYTISGWYRSNSDFGRARVRVSPSASTDWNTAIDLNPISDYGSGATWATFSGTVVATGTNMTLWLDGRTISGTSAKVGCFDAITIACELTAVPPGLTQQPSSQTIGAGGNTGFTVQAFGSEPLSYRWQKNSTNLNDGGHYSGVLTPTLAITGADSNDAGGYRCVVTNAFGSTNSLTAALTVTNPTTPPIITQQPVNQTVIAGGSADFTVGAAGSVPLYYRWQKNNTNLNNGGHYAGVTTPVLTITGADANDAANYRCVVTNAYGSTNSATRTLTVSTPSGCIGILNPGFESGFDLAGGGYIATNWTEWETDPDVVIGYDETAIIHGGAHSQRVRVWGGAGGTSGGVYQRVPVTAGQPYTVGLWIYAGDNLSACSLGVDPSGGTNANIGVIWSSATTNVGWVQKTWTGTATSNYLTIYGRVVSTDNQKRNGYFDDVTPGGSSGSLQLNVQRNGNDLILTWPECPNAHLERAESLTPPASWNTVTNQASVAGSQKIVTITPAGNAGYYRLVLE